MNVVYSSSDSYSQISGISILSLLKNNTDAENINIYMIDNNISDMNKKYLKDVVNQYNRKIIFVEKIDIEAKADTKINIGRWNISTFYRLFLCTILPDNIDRVIYLDCDVIVRHSLKDLWETDMGDNLAMGVNDFRSKNYRTELGLKEDNVYINNGVLLINLQGWRQENIEQKFLEFIRDNQGDITYVDQGVLNGVIGKMQRTQYIEPKYNAMTVFFDFNYKNLTKIRQPSPPFSQEEYNRAVTDPFIVHFTSCFMSGTRPWNTKNNHPFRSEFLNYKALSPWKNMPLIKDDRKALKKMMTAACKILPQFFVVGVISVVHSKIYPAIRKHKHK